jgi:predicted phosphodiesterase
LLALFPTANVIVFGHTHQPAILWVNGTLIFNPGSPCCADKDVPPSVGLLCIQAGGDVKGEIVTL